MLIDSNEKFGIVEVDVQNEQDEGGRRMTVAQNQLDTHTSGSEVFHHTKIIPYQGIHTI